jgi:DNA mismatch endonuclease (patch repair protein)
MAAVKSRNTKPELRLRKALWRIGLRFFTHSGWARLSGVKLPGSPDVIFPSAKLVVFVDGCFWHGCPQHYQAPRERADFWAGKLAENRARDLRVNRELNQLGWSVLRIWEHDVKVLHLPETVDLITRMVREEVL